MPYRNKNPDKLSVLQQNFVNEYLVDFVASHSVLRAGYNTNPNNATKIAAALMATPKVRAAIDKERAKMVKKTEVNVEYVIQRLVQIVEDTDKDNPQAALRGLELLGKHLAMFRDRTEISGPDGGAIETEQRIKEDVSEFTSRLKRLSEAPGNTPDLPDLTRLVAVK